MVIDVVVVDDGSGDGTAVASRTAGARVIESTGSPGNPGAARNRGAAESARDPIVFLEADCVPAEGWLSALLVAHAEGATVVGGAIDAVPGQGLSARVDHYCAEAVAHTFYTAACWARVGVLEPLAMLPAVLAARIAYAAGLVVGGVRWLLEPELECRPLGGRWR